MPSMELFKKQGKEYKESILPIGYKVIVIESGASMPWYVFVYSGKYLITLDRFGLSGKPQDVFWRRIHKITPFQIIRYDYD